MGSANTHFFPHIQTQQTINLVLYVWARSLYLCDHFNPEILQKLYLQRSYLTYTLMQETDQWAPCNSDSLGRIQLLPMWTSIDDQITMLHWVSHDAAIMLTQSKMGWYTDRRPNTVYMFVWAFMASCIWESSSKLIQNKKGINRNTRRNERRQIQYLLVWCSCTLFMCFFV